MLEPFTLIPTNTNALNISIGQALETAEIKFGTASLSYGHGTSNAFDEACVLMRYAMNVAYDTDLTQNLWEQPIASDTFKIFNNLVTRRIYERIPVPYLTGIAYVQGLPLYTDTAVIIPRSLLGEAVFNSTLDSYLEQEPTRILDLCTGSAAIAIQAAMVYQTAIIDAVDIEPAAINLSKRNIDLHQLATRVFTYQGNLYQALPDSIPKNYYDLILSNPPYVNDQSMLLLPPEYRAEPHLALAGGHDGMDFIKQIIAQAKYYLKPNGVLGLEIGFESAYFEQAFPKLPFIYLPVSVGDNLVVLINAKDL